MKHFFVSYTGADEQWAEWIAYLLEDAGYSTTLQVWDFRPGSNFVLEMQRAASEATRTIAVLSPNFLASRFTQPEWAAAFAQDPTGEKGTLVPVRVRDCDLRGLLRGIMYIDLVGADEATAKQKLLAGVQRGRAKPTTAPKFPIGAGTGGMTPPLRPFPGILPPIWNLPFLRNPNFTGRDELIAQLRAALQSGQATALTQPQAIHGLGGIGKTQLAVEYAYRHASEYDIVWFVRAESPAFIAGDLALLAQPLQLSERDERDQNVVVQAVRQELAQRNRWLLILDNAEEPRDIYPFLLQSGHTLITSRNPNWGALARSIDVQVLPREQAIEFLLKRTPPPQPSPVTDRGGSAGDLADELGCLPLALEQAGAYIEANGKTIAEYLQLYRAHQRELLHDQNTKPLAYPATVATTWEISFNAIATQSAASAALLNLLAFFAPDAIPRDVIIAGAEHLPDPLQTAVRDELTFDAAVLPLRRHSLLQVGEGTFAMHRLVQTIVRDRLEDGGRTTKDERKTFAQAALNCINDAFPSYKIDIMEVWEQYARLYAHARAATDETEGLNIAPNETARLLNQVGLYQKQRAELAEAKTLFERALKVYEKNLGENHEYVATAVNNLGSVLQDLGDLPRAKECFERARKIDEAAFDPNHPNVARDVNNLGNVLQDLGDLPRAKECFERALKIWEANLGANHPNVASAVNNLGRVLQDLGDLPRAKECFERALKIDEATFGPNHPNVAIRVNNLGSVLQDLGDLPRAKECFERALKIFESNLGENHPNVATLVNNLGRVLQDLGDLPRAKECFERVIKIFEDNSLQQHPNYGGAINNLGSVLRDLGDLPAARTHLERALKIFLQFLPADHPNIKTVRGNLEGVEKQMRDG